MADLPAQAGAHLTNKLMEFSVYVIKSLEKEWYYVGLTKDLAERLNRHNSGRVRSTKPYLPFVLVYHEVTTDHLAARDREKFFKVRSNKEKLISRLKRGNMGASGGMADLPAQAGAHRPNGK